VKLWLDAHLPPKLVPWLRTEFEIEAVAVRDLGADLHLDGADPSD
jgi:predicted nuclease of predicted toxin-antitoxin system